jgi:hypothetical protein
MALLKLPLGVVKARLTCCRVVSLGGFCGLSFGSLSLFPCVFVWVLCGLLLGVLCWVLWFRLCGFCCVFCELALVVPV